MKIFRAFLMAEFRRALPFLPWLLGLHAMALGARTRWAGEFSNQLVAIIEWTSWSIAVLITVISLWHDAPLRRERFLSTRPQCFLPLLSAKWIALTLMIVLPFGIVDFLALKSGGISGKYLWLGTLQTMLLFLVGLCALFPGVWWWRSVSSAFTALGLVFAALVAASIFLAHLPGNRNLHNGEALGFPIGPMLIAVFLLAFAGLAAASLPLLRKSRDLVRIPVFALLACLSLWLGLWVSVRPPSADEVVKPSIVFVSRMSPDYQKVKYEWFNANAPSKRPESGSEVVWSFSKLRVDGIDVRPWTPRSPSNHTGTFQFRSALVRQFGSQFASPDAEAAYQSPTIAVMPEETKLANSHLIDFELLETRYRWEVVVDMPLKEGASAGTPDSRWRVTLYRPEFLRGPGQQFGKSRIEARNLSSNLWMDTELNRNVQDCPCIVDPVSGKVYKMRRRGQGPGSGGAMNKSLRLESWNLPSWGDNLTINLSNELRFVVLRPTAVRRISHGWKSPQPVKLWTSFGNFSKAARNEELKGINLLEWLGKTPVPPPDASIAEAEAWFGEFLTLLRSNEDQVRDRDSFSKVLAAFLPFVTHHPQLLLKATEVQRDLPWLLLSSILKNLPRDVPKRFPEYATNSFLMDAFVRKGWAGDLANAVREEARRGQAWRLSPILLAVPQEIGLTEAEWLEYFRLNPRAEVYNAIVGKVLTRERLDEEVDDILGRFRIQRSAPFASRGLDLALARGRKEAPRWLKEDFEARIAASSGGNLSVHGSDQSLKTYFSPPAASIEKDPFAAKAKQLEWFLNADPERFVFDPATRKYQLRNDP